MYGPVERGDGEPGGEKPDSPLNNETCSVDEG